MLESPNSPANNLEQLGGAVDVFAELRKIEAAGLFHELNKAIGERDYYGEIPEDAILEVVESPEFAAFVYTVAQHPELDRFVLSLFPFDSSVIVPLWTLLKDALELQVWAGVEMEREEREKTRVIIAAERQQRRLEPSPYSSTD